MGIYRPGRPFKFDPMTGQGCRPPRRPGEYRIRDSTGTILYIGETNDLRRRMGEHIRSGKLSNGRSIEFQLADGRSSSQTRRVHERSKIEQHAPQLNRSGGGEGRIAKRG